jgi:uncharacterized NAD-dependent epimerase/dehydratase family protein
VAVGPPLTIGPEQLTEIGNAVAAGLDVVAGRHGVAKAA